MAEKAGKLNPDEFSDLEPVLDDDSFAFDFEEDDSLSASNNEELDFGLDPGMEPPDLDDINTLEENDEAFDFGTDSMDFSEGKNTDDDSIIHSEQLDDEFSIDSMVSSAGDEYPEDTSNLDLDLDSGLDLIDEDAQINSPNFTETKKPSSEEEEEVLLDSPDLFNDLDIPAKTPTYNEKPNSTEESISKNSFTQSSDPDFSLDLEIDDDDPLIDEKIDQIVNEEDEKSSIKYESKETKSEFNFDNLDAEDEPITLSLEELENIASAPMNDIDEDSFNTSSTKEDSDESEMDSAESSTEKKYTDDELDQILGTDIYEEDEKEAGLLDLGSTDLDIAFDETADTSLLDEEDMSDEPIALSMDELENIMAGGEEGSESENLALDLDIDSAPTNIKEDLDFTDFEGETSSDDSEFNDETFESTSTKDSIFSDEDELADEPITLSLDELENIAAFDDPQNGSSDSPQNGSSDSPQNGSSDSPLDESEDKAGIKLDDIHEELDSEFNNDSDDLQFGDFINDESDELNVESIDDEEADEPITLSMDELSNITGEEEIGSLFDDTLPDHSLAESDLGWAEESTEEEISEKESIHELDEEETDTSEEINLTEDDSEADEPITLSLDELSAITSESEDSADIFSDEDLEDHSPIDKKEDDFDFGDDFSSAFDDEDSSDDKEPLQKLQDDADDELDEFNSLPEPDDSVDFEEFSLEDDDVSSEDVNLLSEPEEEIDHKFFETESKDISDDEDESITLSDDELGNILGGDDELPIITDFNGSIDLTDDIAQDNTAIGEPESEKDSDLYDENAESIGSIDESRDSDDSGDSDEPIALTPEELTDIIGDLPPGEDLEELDSLSFDDKREADIEFFTKSSLDPNDFNDETMIDLDEYSIDGGLSPLEEMRSTPAPIEDAKVKPEDPSKPSSDGIKDSQGKELSTEDKKKVLSYLDNLLGNLPDDMIREFSKSNYFEMYKKLMKEIGL